MVLWLPYDFRIKTMLDSFLPSFACMRDHGLFTLYHDMCCLCIVVSSTYCIVFFCFVFHSGLSIFDCPFGIL